jgi:hypothetical protein
MILPMDEGSKVHGRKDRDGGLMIWSADCNV